MQPATERDAGCQVRDAAPPFATRVARVLRRLIGAPDYGAYLEHCRTAGHPPSLSEREYVARFFDETGKATRCC